MFGLSLAGMVFIGPLRWAIEKKGSAMVAIHMVTTLLRQLRWITIASCFKACFQIQSTLIVS